MDEISISIVIPVINEANRVEFAVARAWAAGANEVIVVDGGSTDGTTEILQELAQLAAGHAQEFDRRVSDDEFNFALDAADSVNEMGSSVAVSPRRSVALKPSTISCRLVHSARGRGRQQNAGASVARGDVLLFLHVDSWLPENGCDQIRKLLIDPSVLSGGFEQRIENDRWIYRWIERGNRLRVAMRGLLYGDQGLFVRRKVFKEVGGFPNVPIMEDTILARALHRRSKHQMLAGPIHVDDRRWVRHGVFRQTIRNWFISTAFNFGASTHWLARLYHCHDQ